MDTIFRPILFSLVLTATLLGSAWAGEREEVTIGNTSMKILTTAEVRALGFTDYPDVSKEDNGAYDLIAAFNAMRIPGRTGYAEEKKNVWDRFLNDPSLEDYPADELRQVLADNAEAFRYVEAAASKKIAVFPIHDAAQTMIAGVLLPFLAEVRTLGRLLRAKTYNDWKNKRQDHALQDIRLMLRTADSLAANPFIITGLAQYAIHRMVSETTTDLLRSPACTLKVTEELLAILKNSPDCVIPCARLFANEKTFGMLALQQIMANGDGLVIGLQLLGIGGILAARRKTDLDYQDLDNTHQVIERILLPDRALARNMATYYDRLVALSTKPYPRYVASQVAEGMGGDEFLGLIPDWDIISSMMLPTLGQLQISYLKVVTQYRLAAGCAVLRLHQLEKKALPKTLQEIPAFSEPALSDPFTDGEPFRFLRKGETWTLYSVGPDMKDSQGQKAKDGQGGSDDLAVHSQEKAPAKAASKDQEF